MSTTTSPKRVLPLHLAVVALTATGFVGFCYVWLRRGRRSSKADEDDCRPPNETEQLYSAHRQGLRRVAVPKFNTKSTADRYRDAGLQRHIQACQATKQKLRQVPDPDQVRKQNLLDIKSKQIKAAGQGPLALSPDQLVDIRTSLRDVSNNSNTMTL
eukprot:scaffold8050_cov180-Amphora_coffeaeformis.AAC.7